METDASDISSAAPNFGVKSRLCPHGKAVIYLVGSGSVLGARQKINKKITPAAFAMRLLPLPKEMNSLIWEILQDCCKNNLFSA